MMTNIPQPASRTGYHRQILTQASSSTPGAASTAGARRTSVSDRKDICLRHLPPGRRTEGGRMNDDEKKMFASKN